MLKRLLCLLAVFVLCLSFACAEEAAPTAQRFDFDLTFSLDPEAFPARARSRARGYAELLDSLQLRGDITICEATQSFDINASFFFRNNPSVSVPFRFYGVPSMLFLTSPLIGNETLLFNMPALAEFSIKVKKSLNTPLPAVALLYPEVYRYNFWNVWKTWDEYTGPAGVTREVSAEQIAKLADAWRDLLANDPYLNVWMTALYSVSSAPEAVEAELNGVPSYLTDFVSGGKPLSVTVGDRTETWRNAAGQTLFSREDTDSSVSWRLDLPADENSYVPLLSFSKTTGDGVLDFTLEGSMLRSQGQALASSLEDEEDSPWPETMLVLSASGSSIPLSFPADSSFSLAASIRGALYPNFDFSLRGDTKKDGTMSVSLFRPLEDGSSVPVLTGQGTVVPGKAETVPDFNYSNKELYGNYNFFSFSEYYMAKFKNAVTKPLLKGLLDFVAEAPTAACQSLLDDLTDAGIINMMLTDQ